MTKAKPTIAAIDDEKSILVTIKTLLKPYYNVLTFTDAEEAFKNIFFKNVSLVILDINMPKINGISVLKKIKEEDPILDVIMLTALDDSKNAISAMKAGAYDYILKPFDSEGLRAAIEKAMERRSLLKENLAYKIADEFSIPDFIGKSDSMLSLFNEISKVARVDSTVLITGETGAGKEMVAKAIHKKSKRKNKPFVTVNCAAIPENLFESELFGHERGAFTGAFERRIGKFEFAEGGTIFLDEVGCLPYNMQAKLLRLLQEEEVIRVGSSEAIPVDARVICATNINLGELIDKGVFRQDLFYRLNVIPVKVPPLRERGEDIILLAQYFLAKYSKKFGKKMQDFSQSAKMLLKKHPWPGNVRELENLIERMAVLSSSEIIDVFDFPRDFCEDAKKINLPLNQAMEEFEFGIIKNAIKSAGGNQSKAAEILKIDRSTLISKLKHYGLN